MWAGGRHRRTFGLWACVLVISFCCCNVDFSIAQELNPTGRTIEIAVPVREGGFYLGDIPLRITADDQLSVPGERFLDLIQPLLSDEAQSTIRSRFDKSGRLNPEIIDQVGLILDYDPGLVEIRVSVPVEQRGIVELSARVIRAREPSPTAIDPASLSGYVNLRAAVDYVSEQPNDDTGVDGRLIDLEGGVRMLQLVAEAEGSIDFEEDEVRRRGTRLVYDDLARVMRYRAGDLRTPVAGFQNSRDTAGLQIERSWRDLQPGRITRPLGRTSFTLDRAATVDLVVNGRNVRQFRLQPGNYDVLDFPLTTGANEVELVIEDAAGSVERLTFDLFFTTVLLEEGLDEFALTAGIANPIEDGEPDYRADEPQLSAFYRRGLTASLTAGANAQLDQDIRQAGVEATVATRLGNFGITVAGSHVDDAGAGFAAAVDHNLILGQRPEDTRRSLRLSAETRSSDFAGLGTSEPSNPFWLDLAATYSQTLGLNLSGSLTARYGFSRDDDEDDRWSVGGNLSRSFGPWSLGLSVAYDEGVQDDGFNAFISASYRFAPAQVLRASYETRPQRARLSYTQTGGDRSGAWNASAELVRDPDDFSLNAGLGYIANRAEINLDHDTRFDDVGETMSDQSTRLRVGTALVFADGAAAISRPIRNSFAIVRPHPNLEGRTIYLNPGPIDDLAQSDVFGPPVDHTLGAYSNQRITYDVEDLPIGYDLGTGLFELFPPYRSGYNLVVGSAFTVTVIGTLLDERGDPVALLTGEATSLDDPAAPTAVVFTNRVGRFGAQGLAPGRWQVRMNTDPPTLFAFEVPEGTVGLYRAGEVRPAAP